MRKPDVDRRALDDLVRRIFGTDRDFAYERTEIGGSTQVYRLRRDGEIFYVRVAETATDSLAPEVDVHTRLRSAGARVPEVVGFEPYDEALQRSVAVTTEIPGGPIDEATPEEQVARIYRAAGRDLARVHAVPVHGFDWVCRELDRPGWPLRGECASYADYVAPDAAPAPLVRAGFSTEQADRVRRLLGEAVELGPSGSTGSLAHGDFDTTHIFGHAGDYSGLIDFGEIRGTDYSFDFATLLLHTDIPSVAAAYTYLEEGYGEARPLPDDHRHRIYLACVLSTAHRVWKMVDRDGVATAEQSWFFRWLRDRLLVLLTDPAVRAEPIRIATA